VIVLEADCHRFVVPVDEWVVATDDEQIVLGQSRCIDDLLRRFEPASCLPVLVRALICETLQRILDQV
jgi:hypothetical protein